MAGNKRPMRRTRKRRRRSDERGGTLRLVISVAILAWLIRSLIVAPFSIPSGSMLPTLFIGDYVVAAKWPYGYSRYSFPWQLPPISGRIFGSLPERGDVVVFRHPTENEDLIKRVIGLPGDTVEVRGGQVILNGKPIPRTRVEPFAMPISANSPCRTVAGATPAIRRTDEGSACLYPAFRETLPGGRSYIVLDQVANGPADEFAPVRVPPGHVFLMGDNRDDSLDSRFPAAVGGIAFVPLEDLVGRAAITVWSTNGSASYWKPWTWFTALRSERVGATFSSTSK